jgi:hypothetical protein
MKVFPIANMEGPEEFLGMDLRDWFAGQALAPIMLAQVSFDKFYNQEGTTFDACMDDGRMVEYMATIAYQLADEMMKIRKEYHG